ncbi:MAG: SDR family oxidoreductase [Nannocystis sp.]|nr:SDR family oxidoreductase [Nannocystis sp.]
MTAKGYALITGASSGIGVDLARELARAGHPLVLVARRGDRMQALAEEIQRDTGHDVLVLARDLSAPNAAAEVHAAITERQLALDVLVNNAGYGMQGRFLDMDFAAVEAMIRVNAITLSHLTQLCARDMAARGRGYVLNVASAAAFLPSPYVSAYAATKSYVLGFSEALRFELQGSGVSVTTLYPGITRTEFNQVAGARTPAIMDLSILSAAQVAQIGVRAMFRRRRAVVPGVINKVNAFFSGVLPRGWVTWMAGGLLARANAAPKELPPPAR